MGRHKNAKPIAGYPSRLAAVEALAKQGKNYKEIASELGLDGSAVSANISKLRQDGKLPAAEPQRKLAVSVMLPSPLYRDFERAAELRAITPERLAARLITIITRENLFEAVLDDGGEAAE